MTLKIQILDTLGICCLLVPFARAQQPSISQIQIIPDRMTVVMSADVDKGPGGCLVVDVTHKQILQLVSCTPAPGNANFLLITPDNSNSFDQQGIYTVTLSNVLFAGTKKPIAQLVGTYPPQTQAQTQKPVSRKGPSCFLSGFQRLFSGQLQAANGSTDADFYFSGQTTHSAGGDFVGTYNLKADLSGLCQTASQIYRVGPSINLAGGNDPNGSPDSLNFSWLWDARIFKTGTEKKEISVHLIQTGTLESTQDFLQKDLVYTGDFQGILPPKTWFGGKVRTHFFPDLGVEAGKNLRGVLPEIDGRAIARMKTAADWFLIFDLQKPWLQDISFETTWARRWPLTAEVTYKTNKTPPTFSAVSVGTAPRDYVKEAFNLDVTKYIGFTVAYEYGSLPPKYAFLDSKFTIGLTVKAKFKQ
jgi:hypothetical protein